MNILLNKVHQFLEWLKIKMYLDTVSENAAKRKVKRGQVYLCNFGVGIGSEMQKKRPAVIVQNNIGNMKSGNTIVIPISHNSNDLPCIVPITPHQAPDMLTPKLDGNANTSCIMCVSKARLGDYICTLSTDNMKAIDAALAKTLGLIGYYSDLSKKLNDKLNYSARVKYDRNNAQNQLSAIRHELMLNDNDDIIDYLKSSRKTVDKSNDEV